MRVTGKMIVIALGLSTAVLGNYLANLCTWAYQNVCVTRGSSVDGAILEILGAVTVGAGIAGLLVRLGPARYPNVDLYCTVCGHRLDWIEQSDQWYCPKCGQSRLCETKPQAHD